MQSQTFLQLLETLKQKGWTDEQISKLSEEVAKSTFAKFYTEAVAYFTQEDLDAIEKCPTDVEANEKIKELYKLRTGNDADQEAEKYYTSFAQKFFEEMQKDS